MPLVSVIMPVYNGEDYLRFAIDSILGQTLKEFEFIIIDDGSLDQTPQILTSYADPRITIVSQRHQGIPHALNSGLQIATGKYIARQDADDISLPERLEKQISFLEKNSEICLLGTFVELINDTSQIIGRVEMPVSDAIIKGILLSENPFVHGTTVFRKSCVDQVGKYREHFCLSQDYDLWLRISERFSVAHYPYFLYRYRQSDQSISRKKPSIKNAYTNIAKILAKQRSVSANGLDALMNGNNEYFEKLLYSLISQENKK